MADLRDVLSEKFDSMQQEPAAPEPAPAPAEAAPAPAEPPKAEPPTGERVRDESGKFAKPDKAAKPKEAPAAPPLEAKPAAPTDAAPQPVPEAKPARKAPQSWRAAVREKWADLPAEVQDEADRLDREYQKIYRESSEARKMAARVNETLAPFEALARSNGMDSMTYAGSVLSTAAQLHMGTPQQKAALLAQIIGTYGVNVDDVNTFLGGQAPQPQQQAQPVNVRAEMQRYFEEMQQQQFTSQAVQAIEKAKRDSEFWNDIGQDKIVAMATALIQTDPNLEPDVALKNAYEILSERTPDVSAALRQRKEAEAARARMSQTQQAQVAAGSVRTQPAAVPQAKPANLRESLERWPGWTERR